MLNEKKEKSSPDYPRLAREVLKASGDEAISKLPAGLYIVATPIGNLGDISLRALVTLANVDAVACEDTRNSGFLLAAFGIKKELVPCHDHNESEQAGHLATRMQNGEAIALVSDAGLPLISDPGFRLVQACHEKNVMVTVVPGANAALTALASSGIAVNAFHFAGFLPPKTGARQKKLEELRTVPATLIFHETPQRLPEMLDDAKRILGSGRMVVIARELTKLYEEQQRGTLEELATFYKKNLARGEIVVIISAASVADSIMVEEDVDTLLHTALSTQSLRDAVDAVSAASGRKRSEVYVRALSIAKQKSVQKAMKGPASAS